eukprot:m.140543 g.140543  ORF g.140543 m.140543 type:complete len:93 (-) comp30123_c1_seq8:111-389(-)
MTTYIQPQTRTPHMHNTTNLYMVQAQFGRSNFRCLSYFTLFVVVGLFRNLPRTAADRITTTSTTSAARTSTTTSATSSASSTRGFVGLNNIV